MFKIFIIQQRNLKRVVFYECKEHWHFKNECLKMKKQKPKRREFNGNMKGLLDTWDDSDQSSSNEKVLILF